MSDIDSAPPDFSRTAGPRLQALGSLILRLEDTAAPADAAAAAAACSGLARDCAAAALPVASRLAAGAAAVLLEVSERRAVLAPELSQALIASLDGLASALGFGPALGAPEVDSLCSALAIGLARTRVPSSEPRATVDWPGPGGDISTDVLGQFTTEAVESLQDAETSLLELERNPDHPDALARLFRAVHSVKGTADYVGLAQIKTLSHRLEDVLAMVRSGRLALELGTDLVLRGVDHLKAMVKDLTPAGEADRDLREFVTALVALCDRGDRGAQAPAPDLVTAAFEAAAEQHLAGIADGLKSLAAGDGSEGVLALIRRAAGSLRTAAIVSERSEYTERTSELLALVSRLTAVQSQLAATAALPSDKWRDQVASAAPAAPPAPLVAEPLPPPAAERPPAPDAVPPAAEHASGTAAEPRGAAAAGKTMRVDQRKLDEYLNLAGELVIARNSLVHAFRQCPTDWAGARGLKEAVAKVDRIVGDVQNNAMGMRMVPVGTVFQRLPRLIRDVSRALGKRIELHTYGEETELDKQVAEALSDPLVHLVRNSADHGIESADARRAAGKSDVGSVTLRAGREGNAIFIDIEDDGGGINADRLKAKAVATGLITAEQAAAMPREQALELIFAAGLSTAKEVSDISGRGVGMDVVRNNIAALGGSVTVHSEPGQGTRIRLILPLTLAVTTVVLVEAGGTMFGLPMDAVKETVKVAPASIRQLRGAPAIALRGEVIPLRLLPDLLTNSPTKGAVRTASERVPVVVLSVSGGRFGVVVDTLRGQQEIVLKPVPPQLGQIDGVGGATIMGDGSIVLILDPAGLHRTALRATDAELQPERCPHRPSDAESETPLSCAALA